MPWFAIHVASNCESQVCDRLDQAGIESFYPYVTEKSRDGRRSINRKFFPGYVFAKFELADRTPVIAIPQVIRILGWVRQPVPVPDSEIAAIRKMTESAPASLSHCPYVAGGETVVIRCGPLQ